MVHIKNKKPIVYGISGAKFHGKDLFASLIKEKNSNFVILHFADELKRLSSSVFDVPMEFFTNSELKEKQISVIDIDQKLSLLESEVGFELPRLGKKASTARELMQLVGTEYIRSVKDNYWVDFIKRKLENSNAKGRFIVADVRFPNEEVMIKEFGKLIQMQRIDFLSNNSDNHASEAISLLSPDLLVGSLTDKLTLPSKVAYLLAINKWNAALKYDYRNLQLAIDTYSKKNSLSKTAKDVFDTKDPNIVKNIFTYYSVPYKSKSNRVKHKFKDGVEKKYCKYCDNWFELSCFNFSAKSWDNHHSMCRECASNYNKERYLKYDKITTLERLLKYYKKNASYRKINFSLTLNDLESMLSEQNGLCYYSGETLSFEPGDFKITIDRLDSDKSYVKNNVVFCCYFANIMKNKYSVSDFSSYVEKIYRNFVK